MDLRKQTVLLQIYQSIASCCLPGKKVSLGVRKRLARLEGYTLLSRNDPTRNRTFCLSSVAEGWVEIKEGGRIPLERVWSRGWAVPGEKPGRGAAWGGVDPCCSITKYLVRKAKPQDGRFSRYSCLNAHIRRKAQRKDCVLEAFLWTITKPNTTKKRPDKQINPHASWPLFLKS